MNKHLRTAALSTLAGGALAALGLLLGPAGSASAADVDIHLDATVGSTTLPTKTGTTSLTVWGYCQRTAADTPCAAVDKPGGPTLTVNAGQTVTVTLHNAVGEASSLYFGGQQLVPDTTGAANGGTATYSFTASRPGTYLYEAGLTANHQHQVAMGLYGALVVRPSAAGQAYADAATAYDSEQVMVVSEIDPALNTAANKAAFDMRAFTPRYQLINGKVHADSDPVTAGAGTDVLLRWVNAGTFYHSMSVLGAEQRVVAYDGSRLLNGTMDISRRLVADTFGPGQTADAIVTVPSGPTARKLPVYDASLTLHNTNAAGLGGALTVIDVAANGQPVASSGPVTSKVAWADATNTLSAQVTALAGNPAVDAVEYLVDTTVGTGTAMTAGATAGTYEATYSTPAGQHILYVHGHETGGGWGPWSSVLVQGSDNVGPTTTGLTLTPDRGNGSATIGISATGNDSASGNSAIGGAEWWIDGGAHSGMTLETTGPVASLVGTIPASAFTGLADGVHLVHVQATDEPGNPGDVADVQLTVDRGAPTTSDQTLTPNPNNGALPVNGSSPAVRLTATVEDLASGDGGTFPTAQSSIDKAEAFLETAGANGAGIPMEAADGAYSSPTEAVYLDIPLATVRLMSEGPHTVYLHGHDAAGNWGPMVSVVLTVDKTAPVVSGLSVTPSPSAGAPSVTLSGTATDPAGLTVLEWFAATDPGVGKATPITGNTTTGAFSTTVDTSSLSDGTVVLTVRARDAAGNVTVGKVPLVVTHSLEYATVASPPVGVAGTVRDVYRYNGTTTIRTPLPGLPPNANIDAYSRVDATHFYLSFSNTVTLAGLGQVQPRDVVYRNGNSWMLAFDGSRWRVFSANVDAIDVVGGRLYLSVNDTRIPGSTSTRGSQSDIYRWNGRTSFTRVLDTSTIGIPDTANVDGFNWLGGSNWAFSFAATNSTVTGFATVPDEDVVVRRNGVWSTWFDGSAHGLTTTDNNRDLEGFTLP
ncbi:multicopper oxidase domain-containing protein [Phycicoccus sp.]|uniref:multicopper oxidase domain-containing protein n=1 Tax=Phycicoccus sp. TaxID=1902410 RepID=UPI002C247D83|nr:multicopper oxidase domain-containing protein [Phycicoccus sp.]HMM94070.1 multicopper oxidase domain-containing protein [Phycicoccus sp.]